MWRSLLLASCVAWCADALWAQDYAPTLKPSPASLCLTPAPGQSAQPEYPESLLERKDGGVVKVELVFSAPDAAPAVRMLDENADPLLVQSVRKHARGLRVPCMAPGADPARLVQTYVFSPNDGRTVMATAARDHDDAQRRLRYSCLQRILPGVRPEYPYPSQRKEEQGKFLVSLRFVSATAEPAVVFVDADRSANLRGAIEEFVKGYRLPCLGAEAVELSMMFTFQMEGGARTRLRDLSLRQFLGAVEPSSIAMPVFLDLYTMACPFDVRLVYHRPHSANSVLQVADNEPLRQPLLDWLSQMTLRLPPAQNRAVLGETMTVTIPCGTVDLRVPAVPSSPSSPPTASSKEKS
jgi:hypothetical protein